MVEWSIEAFRRAGAGAIVVAVPPGHAYEASVEAAGLEVVEGGETRSASVSNALKAVKTDLVAIHDAARPLLTSELVNGVVATLAADADADAAIAAAPLTDTIKRLADHAPAAAPSRPSRQLTPSEGVNRRLVVIETLDRTTLWAAQTPQAFRVEALRAALAGDPREVSAATDEAVLVEAAGGRVLIHPADAENLKVTTPLDLRMAEALLGERTAG